MQNNNIFPTSSGIDLVPSESERILNAYLEDKDITLVEDNIKRILIEMEQHALTLGNLADQSQQARTYEVLHNFYKVMLEANRELVSTKQKKIEIETADQTRKNPGTGTITNNNLFVGSTSELQRFLLEKKKEQDGS